MSAGSIGVLFWGVPLPGDRADIAYGLAERYSGAWVEGASVVHGDTRPPERNAVTVPAEPNNGRHWIGIRLATLPPLPEQMQGRVYLARFAVEMLSLSDESLAKAKAAWAHFADWCTRRGWTPPEPGLYVVADYD